MTTRAVLYARVSGDDRSKEGRNLAGQLEMCREYAQEHAYTIAAELAEDDRGASGAEINLPQLNRVRDMARSGEIDVLVVRELDRLSRNLAKQLIVEQELRSVGVSIEYVIGEYPDTPEGNFQKHVKAAVAELEREKINERMVRGRRQKVKTGNVMLHGHTPYGYRQVEIDGVTTLEIDEQEVQVVRMIFDLYADGFGGVHKIARKLTEMRIPTYRDKEAARNDEPVSKTLKKRPLGHWSGQTVYTMITNETYAGVWRYANTDTTVEVPAIVDRRIWEAVQKRRGQNKDEAKRNTKHEYLLRRRVTCGECGLKMHSRSRSSNGKKGKKYYFYYVCPAMNRGAYARECSMTKSFRADHVDATVWEWVKSFLTDPAVLTKSLEAEQEEKEKATAPLRDRLAMIDSLLADNRAQLERALDLYLSGEFPKEMLTERKDRLQTTIDALGRERADLAAQLTAATLTDEQIQTITEFAKSFRIGLDVADADFEKRRRLIEELDVGAMLAIEDEEKVVYVRCMLGEDVLPIVSICTNTTIWISKTRLVPRG